MNTPSELPRYEFEYPDEAGYPDGTGILSQDQKILIDQVLDTGAKPDFAFAIVNDEKSGIYEAFVGDTEIGGITYTRLAGDRIVLLAASVYPEFRNQGVATDMIRKVLDDIRSLHQTVTIICPIVRTFIDHNPEYEDLVDPAHPGVKNASHR